MRNDLSMLLMDMFKIIVNLKSFSETHNFNELLNNHHINIPT